MTAALTPALALAYLGELSVDVRAAVVLDAGGGVLAGDGALAARAGELLAASAGAVEASGAVRIARDAEGALLAVRARSGVAIAVVAGQHALLPLLAHDLSATAEQVVPAPSETR